MNKRILIATGLYPPESGGPATYTKLLEERLPSKGFSVEVLPFRAVRHLPKMLRHAAYFFKCLRLARRADIVFAQDTVSVGLPAALAAWWAHTPFVVRVPGDYAWEQGRQRFGVKEELDDFQQGRYGWRVELLRRLQQFVVRRAKAVIAPSKYLQRVVNGWGVSSVLIYNGMELPVPTVPQQKGEGFLIVTMARRVPWKGIDALERVVKREKQWQLKVLENLPRAEALGWAKAADAFVLNSTYEGLSHVLLEVMSLGTPIVATSVGGNSELIEDKIEGLLIPPKDDAALHAALKEIEHNPGAARARGEAARTKVGNFSITRTIEQLAELFQRI